MSTKSTKSTKSTESTTITKTTKPKKSIKIEKIEETNESIFVDLQSLTQKNTPIFFVDVSGSTESNMYTREIEIKGKWVDKSVTIMDYEFILIGKIAKKMGYTNCHVICWSTYAKLFENIDPTDIKRLKAIQKEIRPIVSGTYMMSGFNLLTDAMFDIDPNTITELYILTDGEIGDSKKQIDQQIRKFSTKNTDIRIVALERGAKNYLKENCHVSNTLFRYIRECNMTRVVSSFSIYNSLKQEFINFSNPRVPEGFVPYMHDKMFKQEHFRQFMIHVDAELATMAQNLHHDAYAEKLLKHSFRSKGTIKKESTLYNKPEIPVNSVSKMDVLRFTHAISLSIYYCINSIFCNIHK